MYPGKLLRFVTTAFLATAIITVCPVTYAHAEWESSDRQLLADIYTTVSSMVTGVLQWTYYDVDAMMYQLTSDETDGSTTVRGYLRQIAEGNGSGVVDALTRIESVLGYVKTNSDGIYTNVVDIQDNTDALNTTATSINTNVQDVETGVGTVNTSVGNVKSVLDNIYSVMGTTSNSAVNGDSTGSINGRLRWMQQNWGKPVLDNVYSVLGTLNPTAANGDSNGTIGGRLRWMEKNWGKPVLDNMYSVLGTVSSSAAGGDTNGTIAGRLRWMEKNWGKPVLDNIYSVMGTTSNSAVNGDSTGSINGRLRWMQQHWPSGSGGGSSTDLTDVENGISAIQTTLGTISGKIPAATDLSDVEGYLQSIFSRQADISFQLGNSSTPALHTTIEGMSSTLESILAKIPSSGSGGGGEAPDLSDIQAVLDKLDFNSHNDLYTTNDWVETINLIDYLDSFDHSLANINGNVADLLAVLDWLPKLQDILDVLTQLNLKSDMPDDDAIGDLNWNQYKVKSDSIIDNMTQLAPFGAIAITSEIIAVFTSVNQIEKPVLSFDFNFNPGHDETVTIDLTWLDDIKPLINFVMISMLLIGLTMIMFNQTRLEALG